MCIHLRKKHTYTNKRGVAAVKSFMCADKYDTSQTCFYECILRFLQHSYNNIIIYLISFYKKIPVLRMRIERAISVYRIIGM